jgi:hypothetical protein
MRFGALLKSGILAIVIATTGCESNNKGKIEGTKWSNDAVSILGKDLPAGRIKLDFNADGKLVYDVKEKYTGTYSLGMGSIVTLNLDHDLAGSKRHAERIVINGDKLTMTDSNGTALTFSKVVEDQPKPPVNAPHEQNPKDGKESSK